MIRSPRVGWALVFLYAILVYIGLYFTPDIGKRLYEEEKMGSVIFWVYAAAGSILFLLFYFRWRVRSPYAYAMAAVLGMLFFAALGRMEVTTDRLHFLEHGIMYLLIYSALRFSSEGMTHVGRTLVLCFLFALIDEAIQGLLPNREADWADVWTNVFAYYLAAGTIAVATSYGRAFRAEEG